MWPFKKKAPKDITKLPKLIDELLDQLEMNLPAAGSSTMKLMLKTTFKMKRRQYKDKDEFDRILREHERLQAFREIIGLERQV